MPRLLPRRVESLEPRTLLAVNYDLIDLGVTTAAAGEAVYDVSGSVLGPTGVSEYLDGQVGTNRLARSKAQGGRFYPGTTEVAGSKVFPGFAVAHATYFHYKVGEGYVAKDVGTLDPVGPSMANAMGPEASVVGRSQVPGGETHGLYATYRNDRFYTFDLNDFRPAGISWTIREGVDVNALGQILVGGTGAGGATRYAVIRPTRAGTDGLELSGLARGGAFEAVDLNDLGQAVGSGADAQGRTRALAWRLTRAGARVADLGDLGGGEAKATRANNGGYVVGDATTASDRSHAFLYDPTTGRMADLNTVVDAGGLTIRHAAGIDDAGRIAGEATDAAGNRHVVLLLPRDPMPGLAAGASLTDGRLRINGSTGDDVITVSTNARHSGLIDVSINGAVTQFDGTLVRRIEVFAGPGDDRVEVSDTPSASAELYGHSGDDQLVISDPDIQAMVNGGAGDDRISGSPGATSKLYGEAGNDTLTGGDRSDSLIGGSGDDSLAGGNAVNDGLNVLHGGAGDDTLVGGRGLDLAYGGGGNDLILTAAGNDTVNGGDGNDDIDAGGNDDVVNGGAGDDFIRGGEGNDYLYGDAGDDTVWGQSGDDVLGGDTGFTGALVAQPTPAPGDDSLDGGTGNDYLVGSRESLTFADDNGRDTMTGGPGGDVINARGDDVVTDAGADDVVPAARDAGGGPYAVEQTATLTISMPPAFGTASVATPLPGGTGEFAGSTFYADADGTLHMRDVVAREFTLGEFFRNWGVPVTFAKRGRFGAFARASITVNGVENPALDRWVVRAGDVVNVVVAV